MRQKYPIKLIELSYLVRVSFQLRNGCHLIKSMFSEDRNCGKQNITSCGMSVSCSTVDVYMAKPCIFKSTGTGLVYPDRQRTGQILYGVPVLLLFLLVAISLCHKAGNL